MNFRGLTPIRTMKITKEEAESDHFRLNLIWPSRFHTARVRSGHSRRSAMRQKRTLRGPRWRRKVLVAIFQHPKLTSPLFPKIREQKIRGGRHVSEASPNMWLCAMADSPLADEKKHVAIGAYVERCLREGGLQPQTDDSCVETPQSAEDGKSFIKPLKKCWKYSKSSN